MAPRLDFFIIGAPKSGTTSVFDYLAQHPGLFLPALKENHFFARDETYAEGPAYLEAWYREARPDQRLGGAHVNLLRLHRVAPRLFDHNPAMKLIVCLRDPIDRAWSQYHYNRLQGTEDAPTFEEALALEPTRRGASYHTDVRFAYLEAGDYAAQIEGWRAVFPAEQIRVLLTRPDLADRTAETMADLAGWLGVDPTFAFDLDQQSNPAGVARSRWLQRQLNLDNPAKQLYRRLTTPAQRLTVRTRLIGPLERLNRVTARTPKMPDGVRAELSAHFAEPNRRLAALLGRDLGWS